MSGQYFANAGQTDGHSDGRQTDDMRLTEGVVIPEYTIRRSHFCVRCHVAYSDLMMFNNNFLNKSSTYNGLSRYIFQVAECETVVTCLQSVALNPIITAAIARSYRVNSRSENVPTTINNIVKVMVNNDL